MTKVSNKENFIKIIRNAVAGDQKSIGRVCEHYRAFIYTIIIRSVHDYHKSEDLYQEVCIRIYKAIPRFRIGSNLDALVSRITRSVIVDYYRKENRAIPTEPIEDDIWTTKRNLEDELNKSEKQYDSFENALKFLSDEEKTVMLFCFEGLKPNEMVEILSMDTPKIYSLKYQAMKKLKKYLRLQK